MAVQTRELKQGATRIVADSFSPALREGELIASASTPTIKSKPVGATNLTIGTPAVLAAAMQINGEDTPIGEGITYSLQAASDQVLGLYVLHGTVTTDSVPPEVIPYDRKIMVRKC